MVTHDVDTPFEYLFRPAWRAARIFGGDLLRRHSPRLAFSRAARWFSVKHLGGWQRDLFIGVGTTVSAVLALALWRGVSSRLETAAYVGLIGGALGNVTDRLRLGAVVDYLDFHWQGWHWPAFNLADIFVVGGAGLLLLASALERTPQDAQTRVDTEQHPNKETQS